MLMNDLEYLALSGNMSTIILDSSDDESVDNKPGKSGAGKASACTNTAMEQDFIPLTASQRSRPSHTERVSARQTKARTLRKKGDDRMTAVTQKTNSSARTRKNVKEVLSDSHVSTIVLESSDDERANTKATGLPLLTAQGFIVPQEKEETVVKDGSHKGGKRLQPLDVKEGSAAPTRKRIKKEPNTVEQQHNEAFKLSDDILSVASSSLTIKNEPVESSLPNTLRSVPPLNLGKNDAVIDVEAEWEAKYGWKVEEEVAAATNQRPDIVHNVVNLLQKECTIPFIARYRREVTGGLNADVLQDIQAAHTNMLAVKKKAQAIIKTLAHAQKGDDETKKMIYGARTMDELEHLYAPYKEAKGRSFAQRAKALGLQDTANKILQSEATVTSLKLEQLIKPGTKGLENVHDILLGLQHIIAEHISRHRDVLDYLSQLSKHRGIMIRVKKSTSAARKAQQAFVEGKNVSDDKKYDNYIDLFKPVDSLQPHQVMAINRGESQKVLTVKIELPQNFPALVKSFCKDRLKLCNAQTFDAGTARLIDNAVEDAYNRLLVPYFSRHLRSSLTKEAEKESVNVFCSNLRQLLLTPPVRGHVVMGIDPGFSHGCKIAVVSASGDLLDTDVVYPHSSEAVARSAAARITHLVKKYGCDLVALGDGTACRETEKFLSSLISRGAFLPLQVEYCTVNESGVSIYSVTKEAEEELPGMDPNQRSAVGIARRLQDPLLEYVKVEPKHLGVGMYQHDITESILKNALEGVMVECVSFVGVDINVCPEAVLRKVSGLNAATAKNIVEWRKTHGPFKNRQQLLTVKRLGAKAYEQCAGFVKIYKKTSQATCNPPAPKKTKSVIPNTFEPFDMTIIHPESYQFAELFVSHLGLKKDDIGNPEFTQTVKCEVRVRGVNHFVNILGGSIATMQLIAEALQQNLDEDIRSERHKPVFRRSVAHVTDLCVGEVYTGRVKNCTNFGAFVDIGVGKDGLIHTSKMNRMRPKLGDRVTVKIASLDVSRGRIALQLISVDA